MLHIMVLIKLVVETKNKVVKVKMPLVMVVNFMVGV